MRQFVNELAAQVKAEARRLGFDLVGITTPDPPPHLAVYESWLDSGRQGEMAYLASERARQRRADPRAILPEVRSILVLGIRYAAPLPPRLGPLPPRLGPLPPRLGPDPPVSQLDDPASRPTGRVAAYAWAADYHDVLPERLQALVAFLEARVGHPVPNRWYTDTGPILERDMAQRAGLGWQGKNTCLIDPESGSYYLLAEILLGLDLPPDPPFTADHCGTCTRCIDACPTQCILPDRTLDANRCLSYLTIELKGSIPPELRPHTGDWIFGCDICQQVCPWNERFAAPEGDPAFAPRPGMPRPDLIAELSLTQEEFSSKFKGSPIKRAKRRGYLRNVAVALGNSGDPAAVPALARALAEDPEPLVRGHAAWALGRLGEPGRLGSEPARQALQAALHTETDPTVQDEIRAALAL